MKFTLEICLKFQVLGAHFHDNMIQSLGGAREIAFLITLNDSDAGGTQIENQ